MPYPLPYPSATAKPKIVADGLSPGTWGTIAPLGHPIAPNAAASSNDPLPFRVVYIKWHDFYVRLWTGWLCYCWLLLLLWRLYGGWGYGHEWRCCLT